MDLYTNSENWLTENKIDELCESENGYIVFNFNEKSCNQMDYLINAISSLIDNELREEIHREIKEDCTFKDFLIEYCSRDITNFEEQVLNNEFDLYLA
ncbi:MAG: hypothetical protein RR623_06175 [Bacilli bacterium]